MGGEGDENGGGKNPDKGKGKGKNKGKTKTEAQKGNKENTSQTDGKKEDGVKTAGSIVEEDVKKNDAATASGGGSVSNGKKPDGGGNSNNTNELLQEATKLLKSLHLPSAKMIMLQEIGDPQQGPADLMLLDSGATHALRRAKTWSEWDDAEHTVVALAQGTTTSLRIKHGTETLLFTPDDGSFGNGILPMGALTKLGYEITWTGGDCRMKNGHGENVEVTVVNGCPMINRRFGMQLIDQLENESRLTRARIALVRALIQQPTLLKNLPDLDSETLLMVFMKKEFPDLPDTVCRKVVPRSLEIDSEQLPWNRRMRRRMLRAQRVILHLYSGKDQKTWLQLEDANTMVVCLDRAINPKMDMLNDHVMMFLMKIAVSGKLHAIFGGPPCRTVSACRYADDKGPKPVRSEEEPFGLSTLTPQQREWVEDDVTMMFRMKLLYMTAEHHKPAWCNKVLFAMEQPQDPCEYRSQQDVNKYKFMSVWRTTAWKHFQEKYELVITSFEQGAYGHVKPKPTSFGHNITGFEQLHGAKTQREPGHQDTWRHQSVPQRIAESATWSEWAPGVKAALLEGLRRNLSQLNDGRCHLGALGSAEEAPRESNGDDVKPKECGAQLCPLSEVALAKWKSHILHDHQPMRRDCKVCVEAAGKSRQHRRIQHPSAYCLAIDLSGKLKKGKDQFGTSGSYVLLGCYTFPTTTDDIPLCGPGQPQPSEDAPLPALGEMVDEDGVDGDVEDGELPRLEVNEEEDVGDWDQKATERAKVAYDSWMKVVEQCKQVKVKTLTFVEVVPSRATGHIMEGLSKIYSKIRSLGLPVLRLHADRARELTSKSVQAWCHSRDIVTTYTTGSDWKSNGRAENEIGIVKRHAKVLMRAHNVAEELWPILVRHAGERRLRWQLQQVGYPVPELLPFYTKVLVKRKSWNERYAAWRWERAPGRVMGPDPWSSLTSGGYCVQLEDGKFLASTDVVVENEELGNHADVDIVVQERFHAARDQHLAEAPRRRLRYKQGVPQVAKIELGSNSGEHGWSKYEQQHGQQGDDLEEKRLLCMHKEISTVLSEECFLMDDMDVEQASCIPSLSMLAHQKFDVELQLRALDLEKKHMAEEENFLVTKTVTAEQVYNEWNDWKEAMMSEYRSIVEEKRAVRQVSRGEAQQWACDGGVKYEELPSKVVFTRKMGGKRKVRACICGNFEDEVATATYAGGCDASQIRCVARHVALKRWAIFTTDIKCAFLNAERKDRSKLIAMTIPSIYVKLGVATSQDVWLVDAAMYGLVSSPRDWADHRDQVIPTMTWLREEAGRRWKGSFQRAADQHLWHLSERCQDTGEEKDRGIMTVYVDDVLLAADEKTAQCALQAIAAVWECAPAERATLQSSVSFCGFEIQQNEDLHGGGFRLHQHSYEEELAKKWNVTEVRRQLDFKLPTPEEEAEVQRSEDAELVKKAQACTGALLWLATRTRPEISVGVAAMSRLCTKMPELTISIGNKIIAYLQRPTLGLIYAATVGPVHGARDQLDLPRCERTVEAFSDISYASTKGYRSVQGQVYFYAGAPIMWNTNRQPFPTQSTAESELVGLCEALVGGRATASLVAAVRKESEEVLIKRLWGDNAAAISLATGEGQGSWRTRHLRIRAAILRSALWQNEWHLGHLKGRELVADSFTKIVDGASFERALQDLCVVADAKKSKSEIIGGSDKARAKIAMLVGATMLSGAAATEEDEENEEQSWFWTIGLILMRVGAVYIFSTIVRSGIWLHNRLLGSSGSYDGDGIKGQAEPPQLRMLQHSSGEETAERRGRINQQRATYASPVNMSEIQEMVAQSHAAQHDPHNKMHGRDVANWSSSEDDHKPQRPVKLHTSDQLPKRRKKKGKGGRAKQDDDFDEAAIERSWQSMLGTTRNLFAASTLTRGPQSGYSSAAQGSSSKGMGSRAGSNRAEVEQTASSSSSSQQVSSRSGLSIAGQSGVAGQSGQSGDAGQSGAASAAAGSISSSSRTRSGTSSAAAAEHERGSSVSHQNSWNEFQKSYSGRGWGSDRMRAEYWHYRATGKKPL